MGIGAGSRVIEAGTGSGSMTTALAHAVGDKGQVYSYEIREKMQELAKKNLKRLGLETRVDFNLGDISEGFPDLNADAFFLDVRNPHDYLGQVRAALKPGGYFGSLVPTFNQVEQLLLALNQTNFAFIEVCEIMLRYYKPQSSRLRPTDRMIAHTGFLIFARSVTKVEAPKRVEENSENEK